MGTTAGNVNYGCVSDSEPEVREEFRCTSYPWGQSGSPPVSPRLQGPWGEDPQGNQIMNYGKLHSQSYALFL